jgi:hypothetical protein
MKADVLLERLEAVAAALEIRVSYEQLSTAIGHNRGGLCRVKGEFRVIIDKRATAGERVATLATSLGRFGAQIAELDLEISPAVREVLHTHSQPAPATRRAS